MPANATYRSVFKPAMFESQTIVMTSGVSGMGGCTLYEIAALSAHVVITGNEIRIASGVPLANRSFDLPAADKSKPFNGFHLAKTPKVLGG